MGKIQMSEGEPIKIVNYLSCLTHPIIYYCQKLVELVIAWDGKGMTAQNSNCRSHQFLENAIFTYGASYFPKMFPIPSCIHVFVFPAFLELLGTLIHIFAISCVFPHGWKVVFLTVNGWDLCWAFLWFFSSLPG